MKFPQVSDPGSRRTPCDDPAHGVRGLPWWPGYATRAWVARVPSRNCGTGQEAINCTTAGDSGGYHKPSRNLLICGLLAALSFGVIASPVLAQNAPPGPVHFPPPAATNNPATTPAPSPVSAPAQTAPAVAPAPATTNATTAEDIHDIRGPMAIPYEWLWAAYLAGGLAVAAALYAAWRLFRRQAATRAKLPFEIALERLEAARALMAANTVREYAFTVSEIIRVYIEQRFSEKAAHRTTEEFISDLLQQTGTPLAQHRRRLEDFLSHCDLMKFARWEASGPEMESMHESARVFILDTRPQPEPAKATPPNTLAQPQLAQVK